MHYRSLKIDVMSNVHYDILIDGKPYEGNESLEIALGLFRSVDDTCLREYYRHTEEAASYFMEGGKVSKVEILNSEGEVICEY